MTSFTYDMAGNKLTERRPDGGTNRWIYDGLSRVVHQVDPLNQTNSFAYDLAGNVTNLFFTLSLHAVRGEGTG